MAKKKIGRTRLPRLTMLAMSEKELRRFSEATETVVTFAYSMRGLLNRLEECVTRLEARSAAARKANQTRRAPATEPATTPASPLFRGTLDPDYIGPPEDVVDAPTAENSDPF